MDPQKTTKTTGAAPDVQEKTIIATTSTIIVSTPEIAVEQEAAAPALEPLSPTTLTVIIMFEFCDGMKDGHTYLEYYFSSQIDN